PMCDAAESFCMIWDIVIAFYSGLVRQRRCCATWYIADYFPTLGIRQTYTACIHRLHCRISPHQDYAEIRRVDESPHDRHSQEHTMAECLKAVYAPFNNF